MENISKTKIPKFRRCVIQNFPFIENTFDALTDYALISKIVEYLNKVINQQNIVTEHTANLIDAFNILKNYVDNYFKNLDVQEEINNKLDEMAEDGTLQEIIAEYLNASAVWGFDNVADMKTSINLINGSFAKTLGYYAKNDEGGATYKIRAITNEDVVDEFKIIPLNDNTLVAELIVVDSTVNVKQAGCKGDGITDDTVNFQKALNSGYNVFVPSGVYKTSSKLIMPFNISLVGKNKTNTSLKSIVENDYILQYGASYNYAYYKGLISNLKFETFNENDKSYGLYLNSGCRILNCEFSHLGVALSRTTSYLDLLEIRNTAFNYCGYTDTIHTVHLNGSGDGVNMDKIKFESDRGDESNNNGIYIDRCHGGEISNSIINANIELNKTDGFSINNTHIERLNSVITIKDSNVTLNNLFKFKNSVKEDIKLVSSGYYSYVALNLNNIIFSRNASNFEEPYSCEIDELPTNTVLNITNCYRHLNFADENNFNNICYGINIKNRDDFNLLSGLYSIKSLVKTNKIIDKAYELTRGSVTTFANPSTSTLIKWKGISQATRNYRAVRICDESRKIICGYSSNSSISNLINDGDGVILPINNNNYNYDIYLYVGDNIDEYTQRVKIDLTNQSRLYDTGLSCGTKTWETIATTNGRSDYTNVEKFVKKGDNVIVYHTATPMYGTWKKFDQVINTNTTAGQTISWIYNGTGWVGQGTY